MKLLQKVTELVDADIASGGKPISIVGVAVPFLPFMIFVEGPPADSFPVLAAVALAVSICWGLFVMWRYLRYAKGELSVSYTSLGPLRFSLIIAGTILLILLIAAGDIWLSDKIGWPEAYGFSCHGRGCYIQDLTHSLKLLRGGSAYELGLFALIWWLPALIVCILIYALFRWRSRRNSTQPLE